MSTERPITLNRGDPIPAAWLNHVAQNIVQRMTITGGRVTRIGPNIAITMDAPTFRGGLAVYVATADESAGEITVRPVNADGSATGETITMTVLP